MTVENLTNSPLISLETILLPNEVIEKQGCINSFLTILQEMVTEAEGKIN